jgi:hypothetical protein
MKINGGEKSRDTVPLTKLRLQIWASLDRVGI